MWLDSYGLPLLEILKEFYSVAIKWIGSSLILWLGVIPLHATNHFRICAHHPEEISPQNYSLRTGISLPLSEAPV